VAGPGYDVATLMQRPMGIVYPQPKPTNSGVQIKKKLIMSGYQDVHPNPRPGLAY
jgi:hypothetical protein